MKQKNIMSIYRLRQSSKQKISSGEEGAIEYAMAFVMLVLVLMITIIFIYRCQLRLLQQDAEIKLHIVGMRAIASKDMEDSRVHIITGELNKDSSMSPKEKAQVDKVGEVIEEGIKDEFDLDGNKPQSGALKMLCPEGSVTIKDVYLYEPIYEESVEVDLTSNTPMTKKYSVKGWKKYELEFNDVNNDYVKADSITYYPNDDSFQYANKLHQVIGEDSLQTIEGATLELSLKVEVHGLLKVINTGSTGGIFGTGRTNDKYITAWQAVDKVPAATDSRMTH